MRNNSNRVLIVATSHLTRGGITSVINSHKTGKQWENYNCKWIETHKDGNIFIKLFYFIAGFVRFIVFLPKYHIVHIHTSEPPSAIRKSIFVFISKLFRKKIIIHFHSFSSETTIKSNYKFIYKYLFSQADIVLVLSDYWKNEINETFGEKYKLKVLYNPCDEPNYTQKYENKKHILFAGTLNQRKGFQDLIKAFAKIAKNHPDWKIVFAGNGEIEKAKLLAKELNIENQTLFLGWVNGEEKSKAFQEASIFCLPSYAEGFPMAVLDAWSYNLPVVTTPVGGLTDIIVNEKNALIFEPGDIEKLAFQLSLMIDNIQMRQNIASESNKLAKSIFSKTYLNSQLEQIYKDL